ncbi:MAG: aldose 1-epimerase family protein [Opitutaceae bacterium]|nr:aldose 1-epimerase family protein [Opitutaceae bacterium]
MALYSQVLLDVPAGLQAEPLEITPDTVGGPARGYRVRLQSLRGGVSDGVDLIHVDNGTLAFTVIPTRGMGVWKARRGDLAIGWESPVRGPVHPRHVPLGEPGGLGWLDGFDELLVRCGLQSNGASEIDPVSRQWLPMHGRIANLPASHVTVTVDGATGEIAVTGVVAEVRFFFVNLRLTSTIRTRVGQPGFTVHDEIENLATAPAPMQLLYHINFGAPLLGEGARLHVPALRVAPRDAASARRIDGWDRYPAPTAGLPEEVFFLTLAADAGHRTRALLCDAAGRRGVSLGYDVRQLPWFTLWKNPAPLADGYVTGLEPGTNFPNARSFERGEGRVVMLPGGGRAVFDLELTAHVTADEVSAAGRAVAQLAAGRVPEVLRTPQPGWSAV